MPRRAAPGQWTTKGSSTPHRHDHARLCTTVDIARAPTGPLSRHDADLSTIHKPYYYDYWKIFIQ